MLRPNDVTFDLRAIAKADEVRIIGAQRTKVYKDGAVVEGATSGWSYTVLLESNNWEKEVIKCEDDSELVTQEMLNSSEPIYMTFVDTQAKFYFNSRINNWALSIKAKAGRIVSEQSAKKK